MMAPVESTVGSDKAKILSFWHDMDDNEGTCEIGIVGGVKGHLKRADRPILWEARQRDSGAEPITLGGYDRRHE